MARGKEKVKRAKARLAMLLVLLALLPLPLLAQPPSGAAREGFVPIDEFKAQEQLPAAPLVVAAYAAAWIIVFVYLWSIWRRLGKVEREIDAVHRRLESGGRQ